MSPSQQRPDTIASPPETAVSAVAAALPMVVEAATSGSSVDTPADAGPPRSERPDRPEGERSGRRSRRGGRRRRRDPGESSAAAPAAAGISGAEPATENRTPAAQSFDFDRPAVEVTPPPRPEWTPTPPSDATREGPRSEP